MKKRHVNIPIFIPHLGCPNDCVFCNQRIISGVKSFNAESVIPIIEDALSTIDESCDAEIAFFGGSFTGIDQTLMEELLFIANSYLKQGRIKSIRCSTRPDYISNDILSKLLEYGVDTIELGIQSISDKVLNACSRGHSFIDSAVACEKIKSFGLKLGGQMMIGLPRASLEDEISTANFIVSAGADEARIYPTIVFSGTKLAEMAQKGLYEPLDINDAIERSAKVFKIFVDNGIKVLRIGLCDSENLHNESTYFAGPNHAAIGELVVGEYYYNLICEKLDQNKEIYNDVTLIVAKGHTSQVVGQHKKNKIRLIEKYKLSSFKVTESSDVTEYTVLLKAKERK